MSDETEFWAEKYEVLLHKRSRELFHVSMRLRDVDRDCEKYPRTERYYRLQDDTHTTEQYWCEEDMVDCFTKIGETVKGKPVQAEELENWYE